jgi:hypothetical protein
VLDLLGPDREPGRCPWCKRVGGGHDHD